MSDIRKWKKLVEGMLTENPVKDTDYTDHEVSMARSQLLSSVKSAVRIAKHLSEKSEADGIEGWVASKITVAEDYLQAVADYMDGEELQEGYKILPPMDKEKYQPRKGLEGPFSTLSGKVVYYDPKEGKYYDPDTDMYISYEDFQKLDKDYSDMKEDFSDQVKEFGMFSKGGNAQVQNAIQYILNDFNDAAEKATNSERDSLRMDAFRKLSNELEALSNEDGYEEAMDTEVRERAIKYLDQGIIRIMNALDKKPIDEGARGLGSIDWPDADEDGDSAMARHAENAIRHGMHAYDAYDHVYSMSRERDWLSDNKDMIIDMFAQYGLQTESLDEETVKYEDHYDDRVVLTVEKDKLLYNGNPIQNYNWDSAAKHIISDKFYSRAKSWEEVHQYLARFVDNPKGLQAAVRQVFNTNDEGIQVNETVMVSEAQFDEAAGEKDACYRKVKSRYKVWPSAYASGALVKCRKVGAKNWGNSKKK